MRNYLETTNPFSLPKPPQWFLAALWAYDSMLVVFPSLEFGMYQLARRIRHRNPLQPMASKPDTRIFAQHSLIGERRILPPSVAGAEVWMAVLTELPEYDRYRFPSGDAVADRLDEFDAQEEAATNRQIGDELDARSGDAYRLAKARLGGRVSMRRTRPLIH